MVLGGAQEVSLARQTEQALFCKGVEVTNKRTVVFGLLSALQLILNSVSEPVLLLTAAVGLPLFIGSLTINVFLFDNIGHDVAVTFFCCLAFYHLLFFCRKTKSSRDVVRYIDYIYLLIGALALWIAAADLTARNYLDERAQLMDRIHDYLEHANIYLIYAGSACEIERKQMSGAIRIRSRHSKCGTYARLMALAKNRAPLFGDDSSRLLENAFSTLAAMNTIVNSNSDVAEDQKHVEPNVEDLLASAERLKSPPYQDIETWKLETVNRWRAAGYLLAASALAMRITRVSIELGRWFRE